MIRFRILCCVAFLMMTAFCVFGKPICPGAIDSYDVAISEAKKTYTRFIAWKGADEVLLFPTITDVHSDAADGNKQVRNLVWASEIFHFDFMANLGDIGLNIGRAHRERKVADEILDNTREQMRLYPGVFLYAPGNHDWDGGEGVHLSSEFLSEYFFSDIKKKAGKAFFAPEGKCYGYYDVPGKHVRVFVLNSQGTETLGKDYYTFDDDQLRFLVEALSSTRRGTDIVILAHAMPHRMGRWLSAMDSGKDSFYRILDILKDFVNRRSGSAGDLSWDFKKAHGRLAGMFTGDTHANAFLCEEGVNLHISQGFGVISPQNMQDCHTHAFYDWHYMFCADIYAIKLKTKEVGVFRIGAGGGDFDTFFKY